MSEPGSTESRGFKIAVFTGSAIASGVTFANIIYYSKIRKDSRANPPISHTQATTMMWINVGLFVVSLGLLLWSIWSLLFSKETRAKQKQTVTGYVSSGYQAAQSYLASTAPIIPTGTPTAAGASVVPAMPSSGASVVSAVTGVKSSPQGQ